MYKLNEKEKKFILENYENYGPKWCSEKLNINKNSILTFGQKHNLKMTKNGKSLLYSKSTHEEKYENYSSLININTKEAAYTLGLIWSDGYVPKYKIGKNNRIDIKLVLEDVDELKNIVFKTSDIWKIYYYQRENRKPTGDMNLTSRKLIKFLNECGKYPKSSENYDKLLSKMSDNMIIYFYRGLIDGDGCFYKNKNNCTTLFTITSNYNQDWKSVEDFFIKNQIIYHIQRKKTKNGNASVIFVQDKKSLNTLIELIYKEKDGIYLKRKLDKANEILKYINLKKEEKNEFNKLIKKIVEYGFLHGPKWTQMSKELNDENYTFKGRILDFKIISCYYHKYLKNKKFFEEKFKEL